jgi:hypothetical protein
LLNIRKVFPCTREYTASKISAVLQCRTENVLQSLLLDFPKQVVNALPPLFTDNPKDSGYQGSGDCYDDEDCDTEGSGSGGGGSRPRNGDDDSEGSGGDWDDYYRPPKAGEPEPQWPPWVTGKTPAAAQNTPPAAGPTPPPGRPEVGRPNAAPQTPPATASAATPASSALYTALLVYALPVLLTCLGSLMF